MSTETFPSFVEFFNAVTCHEPYSWQLELASFVKDKEWPGRVEVPTGLGKTATIAIAVYELARQLHFSEKTVSRTAPQRIFHIVNRRSLVESTGGFITELADRINSERDPRIVPVREALQKLLGPESGVPIVTAAIHGQSDSGSAWLRATGCIIVTCTPHQFVSRLLMRGFGVSPGRRPIDAGLLGVDRLVLFDEPHLATPAVQTIVDAEQIQSRATESLGIPGGSTVLIGATLSKELVDVIGRDTVLRLPAVAPRPNESGTTDLANERLFARRRLHLQPIKSATDPATAKEMVRLALAAHREGCRSIVVFANTVALAQKIYRELRGEDKSENEEIESTALADDTGLPQSRLITSRFRPIDRAGSTKLESDGPPGITVTTQVLEVGVDISFDALVTELAPWNPLVQRLGRLNRRGRDKEHNAYLVAAPSGKVRPGTGAVYDEESVKAAFMMLQKAGVGGSVTGIDASPAALMALRGAHGSAISSIDQRLPRSATLHSGLVPLMAQTRPTPMPDLSVEAFILGPDRPVDPEVSVAWRAHVSALDQASFGDVLSAEEISIPRRALARLLRQQPVGDDASPISDLDMSSVEDSKPEGQVPLLRFGDVRVWDPRVEKWRVGTSDGDVLGADRVVLPSDYGGYDSELGWTGEKDRVDDAHLAAAIVTADKAFAARGSSKIRLALSLPAIESVKARLGESEPLRKLLEAMSELNQADGASLEAVADVVVKEIPGLLENLFAENLPKGVLIRAEVDTPPADIGTTTFDPGRMVGCTVTTFARQKPTSRSNSKSESELLEHLEQVGRWAAADAEACGMEPALATAVGIAGYWHDVGKALRSFQSLLAGSGGVANASGKTDQASLLAKSNDTMRSDTGSARYADQRARDAAGVPKGFRHEAESVARFRIAVGGAPLASQADHVMPLIEHLIGSHHGWYRPMMPPVREAHLQGFAHADDFSKLHARYGPWGVAYLEALLRLADWRASAKPSTERDQKRPEADPFAGFKAQAWERPLAASPVPVPRVADAETYVLTGLVEQLTAWFAAAGLLAAAVDAGDESARLSWEDAAGGLEPTIPVLSTRLPLRDVVTYALDAKRWEAIEKQLGDAVDEADMRVLRRKNQKLRPADVVRQILSDAVLSDENPIRAVRGFFGDAMSVDAQEQLEFPIVPFANNSSYPAVALAFIDRANAVEECLASLFDRNRGFHPTACDGGMDRSRAAQPLITGLGGVGNLRQVRTALAPLALYGIGRLGNTGSTAFGVRGNGRYMRLKLPITTLPVTFEELRARLIANGGPPSWHWEAIGGDWEYAARRDSLTDRNDDSIWSGKITQR